MSSLGSAGAHLCNTDRAEIWEMTAKVVQPSLPLEWIVCVLIFSLQNAINTPDS